MYVALECAHQRIYALEELRNGLQEALTLFSRGKYVPQARALMGDLVSLGCPAAGVGQAIQAFFSLLSPFVEFKSIGIKPPLFSRGLRRTVACVRTKRSVWAKLQLAHELKKVESK